jgi:hypothetical protein
VLRQFHVEGFVNGYIPFLVEIFMAPRPLRRTAQGSAGATIWIPSRFATLVVASGYSDTP